MLAGRLSYIKSLYESLFDNQIYRIHKHFTRTAFVSWLLRVPSRLSEKRKKTQWRLWQKLLSIDIQLFNNRFRLEASRGEGDESCAAGGKVLECNLELR
ncbi:hypothetical protein CEXT_590751 [Caerostris extrusa]|uniref:Uncharacterized protein n=1 Tax=Caerostris extrusa TaxID=172846 RepID=A0AAV4XBL7_CAEEX|nr:hypothetical protein CEXT_590751 [Caerostris extrusa]